LHDVTEAFDAIFASHGRKDLPTGVNLTVDFCGAVRHQDLQDVDPNLLNFRIAVFPSSWQVAAVTTV
jgi:hypothetical protein